MSSPEDPRQIERQPPLEAMPEENPEHGGLVAFQHEETTITLGPLPSPAQLAKYEAACPGAADRIISMAERQSAHRQAIEAKVVGANCAAQRSGPAYGFALVLSAMVISAILLWNGKDIAGITTLVSALAAIVITFVVGKRRQRSELEKREFRDLRPAPSEEPQGKLASESQDQD